MNEKFSDYVTEMDDMVITKPPAVVRWGTTYFFLLFVIIILLSWFIKYPDVVVAKGKLSCVNAPREVSPKFEGKLTKISVAQNENVRAGQVIGFMESIADPKAVMEIGRQVDSINSLIARDRIDEIEHFFPDYTSNQMTRNLGELQTPYQTFIQSFIVFKDFLSSGFFQKKKKMLLADIQTIEKMRSTAKVQEHLLEQDLLLTNETFHANESLLKDKIISPYEYRTEKSKLISKQLSMPQIKASILTNESQQNEKRKEIVEIENQVVVQRNTFIQALETIKSEIKSWQFKYFLTAPVSGKVSFIGFFQENQEMKAGQTLFSIRPDNASYFVEMEVPQYNFGKIRRGQPVLLKFQAYPFEQYGPVVGKIEYINETPTDNGYLVKVALPNGLITAYNKPLQFHNGLSAQADIITENMRLLDRLYYSIVKHVKR